MTEKYKILLLDDEVEILNSLKRLLRKEFEVSVFSEPNAALEQLKTDAFALIVSDMRMPEMDGATFLTHAKQLAPDSIRILLTGYSDLESTSRAINEGQIFSYISKPWNNDELKQTLDNACEHYKVKLENQKLTAQIVASNKALQELNGQLEDKVKLRTAALNSSNEKLKSSVEKQRTLFQQLIELVALIVEDRTHDKTGHNKRVALHSKLLAEQLKLKRHQVINIYISALVHDLGKIALDDSILSVPEHQLDSEQTLIYQEHAIKGAELLATFEQLTPIATTIKHQFEHADGTGVPEHLSANNIPMGAKIIRLVVDYDRLIQGFKTGSKLTPEDAFNYITKLSGKIYDDTLVKEYKKLLANMPTIQEHEVDYCIAADDLEEGMSLAKDILNKTGGTMLTKGTVLSPAVISKLLEYEKGTGFRLTIYVY